jgi:hypothetical protein
MLCAAGSPAQPATALTLRLCKHSSSAGLAVAPVAPGNTTPTKLGPAASPARPSSASSAFAVTPPRAGSSSSSSKGKSGRQAGAGKNSRGSSSSAAKGMGGMEQPLGGQAAGTAVADWQLRLLRSGVDWSNSAHVQLLERLAVVHLQQRLLLPGESLGYTAQILQTPVQILQTLG